MKGIVAAVCMVLLCAPAHAAGPIGSARASLREAQMQLNALLAPAEAERDAFQVDVARGHVRYWDRHVKELQRSVAKYQEEHDIASWKLGDKVRSPVVTGEFLGGWQYHWTETGRGDGVPECKLGLWDVERATGLATIRIRPHVSAADALEEVLIGGALPAPPPRRGVGNVGFAREPTSSFRFVRDNILVDIIARPHLGHTAEEIARRVDAMILASPVAVDPSHPTVLLEPGLDSRKAPTLKREGPIPTVLDAGKVMPASSPIPGAPVLTPDSAARPSTTP